MNSAAVSALDRVLHSRSLDHCEKKELWFQFFLYSSSSFSLFVVPYSQIHSWRKGKNSFRSGTWHILIILFYCLNNRDKIMIKFLKITHKKHTCSKWGGFSRCGSCEMYSCAHVIVLQQRQLSCEYTAKRVSWACLLCALLQAGPLLYPNGLFPVVYLQQTLSVCYM